MIPIVEGTSEVPGPGRPCIWPCGNEADSDEDIVSNWIRRQQGWRTPDERRFFTQDFDTGLLGYPTNGWALVASEVVCQDVCNGGWMSRLETTVKPFLGPMIRGEPVLLSLQQQQALRRWAAMKGILLEYSDRLQGKSGVNVERRRAFYEHESAPPDTLVCLAQLAKVAHRSTVYTGRLQSVPDGVPLVYASVFTLESLAIVTFQGQLRPDQIQMARDWGIFMPLHYGGVKNIPWPFGTMTDSETLHEAVNAVLKPGDYLLARR